ncbi:putative MFS family arabinose efflux permease [Enterococcus sp. PF1-24]|uniref:MFS transporter n=1 Tax=unclassified Enterococcus TaxID=2608891 RepID=UPI0024741E80|nr:MULTISPECIES: MFS transporter [unclassified Enterococcus]MDH6364160.1 putative MFS family arabinose efflux permease [Enterococcus sp. PFB1-1]MDH6401261.1 putative MFS family arabinose efflux permease [Enterococcus sp. PF1-24]
MNKNIGLLLLGIAISRVAYFMTTPFLTFYLVNLGNISPVEIGVIVSSQAIFHLLSLLIVPKISNHLPLKTWLILIAFGSGISNMLLANSQMFVSLFILNGLNGFWLACYEPQVKLALSLLSEEQMRLKIFNLRYTLINFGAVIGPLLNNYFQLNDLNSHLILSFAYFIVGLLNCSLVIIEDDNQLNSKQSREENKSISLKKQFILLIVAVTFSYFAYSQLQSTIPQFLIYQGKQGLAIYRKLLSTSGLLIIFLQFPIMKITKKYSMKQKLIVSNLNLAICLLFAPYLTKMWGMLLFLGSYVLGEILLGSNYDYAVDKLADDTTKSSAFIFGEIVKIGSVVGPILGNSIFSFIGWQAAPWLFAIFAGITLIGSLLLKLMKDF